MQRSPRSAALAAAFLAVPLMLLAAGGSARAQAPSAYVIRQLSLAGSELNYGTGINNNGVAVGAVDSSGALNDLFLNAAIYQNGGVSGAGVLVGYQGSYDNAVNDLGESVGWAIKLLGIYPGPELTHAVYFVHDSAQDLGALPGNGNNSVAYAINQSGLAAGSSQVTPLNYITHAVLFSFAKHSVTDLGTLPGDNSSVAYGINDYGQVVGDSSGPNNFGLAVLFEAGAATSLGTLPGDTVSGASAINEEGQAVGYSQSLRGPSHAVMFANGKVTDLGVAAGGTGSQAAAINNFGQVVGSGDVASGYTHALLFQNGQVIDLGTLPGGNTSSASGINDRGDIVGTAQDAAGNVQAVEWTLARRPATGLRPLATR